ncbi:MAG: hypothetical protein RL071_173, partial [Pseudomonadota bacterium]
MTGLVLALQIADLVPLHLGLPLLFAGAAAVVALLGEASDDDLVARAQGGDTAAFAGLVRRH